MAQAGFELGPRRLASPGVLPGVQRRAANRTLAPVAAASRPLDSIFKASVSLSRDTPTHFIMRTPGPKDGEETVPEVTAETSDRASAPTCWLFCLLDQGTLRSRGPAGAFF